jgi:trans-aconitate 2-methyltransferase
MWDATLYLRFGGERARPFFDLLARVGAEMPRYVVDLGCGPGHLTATLAQRWPSATVCGVDNSPQMIEAARQLAPAAARRSAGSEGSGSVLTSHAPGLSFMLDDIRHWEPQSLPDVIVSNAVLQWVPGHRELLVRWAGQLADGGWLAFQVPGNFDQPSHVILREMAASARWRSLLRDVELNRQSASPVEYAELLAGAGCEVDAWETTCWRVQIRCSSGIRAPAFVPSWLCSTPTRPRISSPSTARRFAWRIRQARSARFFPSAGCSPSPTGSPKVAFSYCFCRETLARSHYAPWSAPPVDACPAARSRRRLPAGALRPAMSGPALTQPACFTAWPVWLFNFRWPQPPVMST